VKFGIVRAMRSISARRCRDLSATLASKDAQ
jgi:hypothetical protein